MLSCIRWLSNTYLLPINLFKTSFNREMWTMIVKEKAFPLSTSLQSPGTVVEFFLFWGMRLFPLSLWALFLTPYLVSEEWSKGGGESLYPAMSTAIKQTCLRTKTFHLCIYCQKREHRLWCRDNGQNWDLIKSKKDKQNNVWNRYESWFVSD